jgi:CTP:molybdopterin cytidylyltransferase MocA
MQALVDAATADEARRPLVVPRYLLEPGPRNPALLLRDAWGWVDELEGDRGLSALMDARPDLVLEVTVGGSMPDVDEPADLARLREVLKA